MGMLDIDGLHLLFDILEQNMNIIKTDDNIKSRK